MRRLPAAMFCLLACAGAAAQSSNSLLPLVRVETTHGTFVLQLDAVRAPLTAENFLRHVRDGYYDGTLFHRVISNFVVQGGGHGLDFAEKPAGAPVPNESGNGLSNRRGTLGLARTGNPHSGSAQFYINLVDNTGLDPLPSRWGFAVFGRVVEGMDVVDRIAHLPTGAAGPFPADLPRERAAILRARVIESLTAPPAEAPAAPPPPDGAPSDEPPPTGSPAPQ